MVVCAGCGSVPGWMRGLGVFGDQNKHDERPERRGKLKMMMSGDEHDFWHTTWQACA